MAETTKERRKGVRLTGRRKGPLWIESYVPGGWIANRLESLELLRWLVKFGGGVDRAARLRQYRQTLSQLRKMREEQPVPLPDTTQVPLCPCCRQKWAESDVRAPLRGWGGG